MYEPPVDLPEAALEAGLRVHYGLDVAAVTMLSLGGFMWVMFRRDIRQEQKPTTGVLASGTKVNG